MEQHLQYLISVKKSFNIRLLLIGVSFTKLSVQTRTYCSSVCLFTRRKTTRKQRGEWGLMSRLYIAEGECELGDAAATFFGRQTRSVPCDPSFFVPPSLISIYNTAIAYKALRILGQ